MRGGPWTCRALTALMLFATPLDDEPGRCWAAAVVELEGMRGRSKLPYWAVWLLYHLVPQIKNYMMTLCCRIRHLSPSPTRPSSYPSASSGTSPTAVIQCPAVCRSKAGSVELTKLSYNNSRKTNVLTPQRVVKIVERTRRPDFPMKDPSPGDVNV